MHVNKKQCNPVILIPGLGGSILINKHAPQKVFLNKKIIDNKWISSDMIHPKYHHKWSRDIGISVKRNPITLEIVGFHSKKDIVPYDFGGLHGVQNVAPELIVGTDSQQKFFDQYFNHRYFGPLITHLEAKQLTVYAAPYDFRTILDPDVRHMYWKQLKKLITDVTHSTEKPVVLVAHSQGAALCKWLLHDADQEWVKQHIKCQALINCPFGGCPQAVKTVLRGAFYLPLLEHVYKKHVEINSGIIMGLPNSNCYNPNDLFWKDSNLEIRMYDIIVNHHLSIGFEVWNDLYANEVQKLASESIVPTHLFTSMGIPTEQLYLNEEPIMTDGDGMIPAKSLMAFKHAASIVRMRGVDHTGILRDPQLASYIHSLCSTS